jgi:hypothetical protein
MLIFGDQQYHLEMRVRMACELALNKEFYLNNENHKMYEFDTFPYCSMITTYSQHFKPGMDTQLESIAFVFEEDAMKTAKTGTYCGILKQRVLLKTWSEMVRTPKTLTFDAICICPKYGNFLFRHLFTRKYNPVQFRSNSCIDVDIW